MTGIYHHIIRSKRLKHPQLAVLVDPDKVNVEVIKLSEKNGASFFFVGGSHLNGSSVRETVRIIKKHSKIPVILFPGDTNQVSDNADAILFLSLISGRNPEYLIGKQVASAAAIRRKQLESIATGYILLEGNTISSTQKVTGTKPISQKNRSLIVNTALAGEMLGMKMIYLEAGSGAENTVNTAIIKQVKKNISIPLIVGGGIDSAKKAHKIREAGADIIVVGNALEKNAGLLQELAMVFKQ